MKKLLGPAIMLAALFVSPASYAQGPVYANTTPPPPQAEVIPAAPSPNHMWIHGHWRLDGGRYAWEAGRWEVPPHPGQAWTAAHYEPDGTGNRWGYVGGRWNDPPHVTVPPPVPVPEVQPPSPGAGYTWAGGHYQWNGSRHFWIQGRWITPPAGRTYVEPGWDEHGHEWRYRSHGWR